MKNIKEILNKIKHKNATKEPATTLVGASSARPPSKARLHTKTIFITLPILFLLIAVLIAIGITNAANSAIEPETEQTFTEEGDGYYIWVRAVDHAGNKSDWSEAQRVWIETGKPTITIKSNSNTTWAKTGSVTVALQDSKSGLAAGASVKYGWSESLDTAPSSYTDASLSYTAGTKEEVTFTAEASGLTGQYYLWVVPTTLADTAGNTQTTTAKSTGKFYFDNTGPTCTSVEIKNVDNTGYDVYVYGVTDGEGVGVDRVQFPTWTDYNGQDDIQTDWWVKGTATGTNLGNGTWYYRVNASDHSNEGGWYETSIRLYDSFGNWTEGWWPRAYVDRIAPTYSYAEIKNANNTGYDVYVYGVTDGEGVGVNRLQFPTWTDYNGQDDIQPAWQTNSAATGTNLGNGTWYYRVNTSAHNNEGGLYITHIYAYDSFGNEVCLGGVTAQLSSLPSSDTLLTSYNNSMYQSSKRFTVPSEVKIIKIVVLHNYEGGGVTLKQEFSPWRWADLEIGTHYVSVSPGQQYQISADSLETSYTEFSVYYSSSINTKSPTSISWYYND